MFVFLSKLLPLFVYPLGLSCILLIAAIVLRNRNRVRNLLIVIAIVILWLSSTSILSNALAKSLEWQYLPLKEIPISEVIVVLGGGTEAAIYPRPGVEINSAGDRVLYAAQLYKEGKARHILLTGGEIDWLNSTSSTPAEEMATILKSMGIPEDALWLETRSQNTYENALYSKQLLDQKGIKKIILITSAMHMPRAVALFQKQGLDVIPVPVDFSITQADALFNNTDLIGKFIGLLPSASSLSTTTNALKEYLGILTYHLQGWL
jgi:uncharacterized SAM-binding protein YcdF (DUF218 family)